MNNTTNIIWDLGNVLFPFSRVTEEYCALCHETNVEIALEVFPMLSPEEAQYLVDDCYQSYQDCYGAFVPVMNHYGLDLEETRLCLFKRNYAKLYELLMKHCPDIFAETTDLVDAFRAVSGRVKHGILSQCWMEGFGIPALNKLGILPFFEPKAILGLDQVGFVKKADSIKPLRVALELMDAAPEQTYFVEDTLVNLERASKIKGLHCIYINHGKLLDELPSFVSNQFRGPIDFLRSLKNMGEARIPAGEIITVNHEKRTKIEKLLVEIDALVSDEKPTVRIDVYGGGIDESYLRGNEAGLIKMGVSLIKSGLAPYKNPSSEHTPDAVAVDMESLFHDESDITIDWIERTDNLDSKTNLVSEVRRQRLSGWTWAIVGFLILTAILFLRYFV